MMNAARLSLTLSFALVLAPRVFADQALLDYLLTAGNVPSSERGDTLSPIDQRRRCMAYENMACPRINGPRPPGEDSQWLCKPKAYSLSRSPAEFVSVNPNSDVLYPGALVQGSSLPGGILAPIRARRGPGTVNVNLLASTNVSHSKSVQEVSLSSIVDASNSLVHSFDESTSAALSVGFDKVWSNDHMGVMMGVNVQVSSFEAKSKLKFDENAAKQRVLITFTQAYYTIGFDPPPGPPTAFFHDGTTVDDVRLFIGPGNPPAYVSNVVYGRLFYVLLESSSFDTDLLASAQAAYKGGSYSAGFEMSVEQKKVLGEARINAYALGGNAEEAFAAIESALPGAHIDPNNPGDTRSLDALFAFLRKGATFGPRTPAVPLSYTVRNLTGQQIRLNLTTEFVALECVPRGCDGRDPTKVLDDCRTCGGTNHTGCLCKETYLKTTGPEDQAVYCTFHLKPAGEHTEVRFKDGVHKNYSFPLCRRLVWNNVGFECRNTDGMGNLQWVRSPAPCESGQLGNECAVFTNDHLCHGAHDDEQEVRAEVKAGESGQGGILGDVSCGVQ